MSKCCFCGKEIEYKINGNDPRPIKIAGEEMPICCNECNAKIVIPTRIKLADLEAKLAEKEKAYQKLLNSIKIKDLSNINFIQVNEDIIRFSEGGVLYEYNKKDNTIYKIIDKTHQDKISFALEQLEKVKEYCRQKAYHDSYGDYMMVYERRYYEDDEEKTLNDDLMGFLDNQIEELKKENENEG